MSDMTGEACACLTVQFKPKEHEDGSWTGRWLCSDCGREFRPATSLEPSAKSARHLQLLATMEAMRRLNVKRYRAGDVEIELSQWSVAPRSRKMQRLAELFGMPDASDEELAETAVAIAARDAGYLDARGRPTGKVEQDLHKPAPEPPDEQPAVEIDFAATEELLRAQDARRRGQGA